MSEGLSSGRTFPIQETPVLLVPPNFEKDQALSDLEKDGKLIVREGYTVPQPDEAQVLEYYAVAQTIADVQQAIGSGVRFLFLFAEEHIRLHAQLGIPASMTLLCRENIADVLTTIPGLVRQQNVTARHVHKLIDQKRRGMQGKKMFEDIPDPIPITLEERYRVRTQRKSVVDKADFFSSVGLFLAHFGEWLQTVDGNVDSLAFSLVQGSVFERQKDIAIRQVEFLLKKYVDEILNSRLPAIQQQQEDFFELLKDTYFFYLGGNEYANWCAGFESAKCQGNKRLMQELYDQLFHKCLREINAAFNTAYTAFFSIAKANFLFALQECNSEDRNIPSFAQLQALLSEHKLVMPNVEMLMERFQNSVSGIHKWASLSRLGLKVFTRGFLEHQSLHSPALYSLNCFRKQKNGAVTLHPEIFSFLTTLPSTGRIHCPASHKSVVSDQKDSPISLITQQHAFLMPVITAMYQQLITENNPQEISLLLHQSQQLPPIWQAFQKAPANATTAQLLDMIFDAIHDAKHPF